MAISFPSIRRDTLAGLTASFALVPESIAFALVASLNPMMGLYGAAIICGLTALLGGRPGMISGAAGSMAVVIVSLVVSHGVQYFLWTVLLSGALMMLFGLLRMSTLIRMIPHPVMLGFVNGLAIVIAMSQLAHFRTPQHEWLQGQALWIMLSLAALTMAIVYLLPKIFKALPPALVAILTVGALTQITHIATPTLGDMADMAGGWPTLRLPTAPLTLETLQVILPYAVIMAMVGLLETLLTYNLTNEITETKGQPNRECVALGASNIVSGLSGGMGGCAMIGQTMINLGSNGRGRLSGVVCGVMVLLYILYLSPWIARIPLAALVGVMLVVAQQTFAWNSLRAFRRAPKSDVVIIVAVTIITVLTDLAVAVLCGVVIAALSFAWKHAARMRIERMVEQGRVTYRARGTLFFAASEQFQSAFQVHDDNERVTVDARGFSLADQSAVAALTSVQDKYVQQGKVLTFEGLDAESEALLRKAGVAVH